MRRDFLIAATLPFLLAVSTAHGADYVVKRITCPVFISVEFDWVKHIGSDPTFTESSGATIANGGLPHARFQRIWQEGQVISCSYDAAAVLNGRHATYSYTVKRKILGCKKIGLADVPVLECRLEP